MLQVMCASYGFAWSVCFKIAALLKVSFSLSLEPQDVDSSLKELITVSFFFCNFAICILEASVKQKNYGKPWRLVKQTKDPKPKTPIKNP